MANFFYPKQRHATGADGWYDLIRWICDNHATLTGPGYTVIEADDGTNINTPSGPNNDLTELGASNRWNPDNANFPPPTGSWIVLESLDSNNTNHFQVIFQLVGNDLQYRVIPLEDFTTGGGTTAPSLPTLPSTAFGEDGATSETISGFAFTALYNCTATEGNLVILSDHANDAWLGYIGETDNPDPADDRSYVSYRQTNTLGPNEFNGAEPWARLSPVDDTTVIGIGNEESQLIEWMDHGEINYNDPDEHGAIAIADSVLILPAGVMFATAGHRTFSGWLRNLRVANSAVGMRSSTNDREWIIRSTVSSAPAWAMRWDGSTTYP